MANIIKVSHSVQYINDGKAVTSFVCVKELIRILRNSSLLAPFSSLLDTICPRPLLPYRYTNHDLLEQLVVAGLLGREDFNDAQELNNDTFARSCLKRGKFASAATLSRFFSELGEIASKERNQALEGKAPHHFDKTDAKRIRTSLIDSLNKLLLQQALDIVEKDNRDVLIVDVDSTPVPLHGTQEERAYDGHYGVMCYLPIMVTINETPAFVQNAPGAANGAKLFLLHADELIETLQKRFPKRRIIVRADTGFSNQDLLNKLHDNEIGYIVGCNPCGGRYIHPMAFEQFRLDFPDLEEIPGEIPGRLLEECGFIVEQARKSKRNSAEKYRCCGVVREYRAANWKHDRTLVYRLAYNPDFDEINLRYIQTNLTQDELIRYAGGRGEAKGRASVHSGLERDGKTAKAAVEAYEGLFCDRGIDEQNNRDWKRECAGARCSLEGFFANSIRMILGVLVDQIALLLKQAIFPQEVLESERPRKKRNGKKSNRTAAHKATPILRGPSLKSLRLHLLCAPAKWNVRQGVLRVHMNLLPRWERAFLRLCRLTTL